MITEALILILRHLLDLLFSLLPDPIPLPVDFINALQSFQSYFNIVNKYFPVDTLFIILSFYLFFEFSILSFKILNWILNKIRGSG